MSNQEKKIPSQILRLIEAYRTMGIWKLFWIGPQWDVRQEFVLLCRDLHSPIPENVLVDSIRPSILGEKEIPLLSSINPMMSETETRRRLEEGMSCFLFRVGSSLAHYRWYAPEKSRAFFVPYLGKTLQVQQGDHFAFESFTSPIFRKQGILSATSGWCLRRSKDLGFNRSLALIAGWNTPSMRVGRDKAGRAVLGTVGYWNLGLCRHYFATGDIYLDQSRDRYVVGSKNGIMP